MYDLWDYVEVNLLNLGLNDHLINLTDYLVIFFFFRQFIEILFVWPRLVWHRLKLMVMRESVVNVLQIASSRPTTSEQGPPRTQFVIFHFAYFQSKSFKNNAFPFALTSSSLRKRRILREWVDMIVLILLADDGSLFPLSVSVFFLSARLVMGNPCFLYKFFLFFFVYPTMQINSLLWIDTDQEA